MRQLISEELFKKVTSGVTVSKEEIKAYYTSHKSQYGQPQTRDVRHILVTKKALADQLYAQLKSGGELRRAREEVLERPRFRGERRQADHLRRARPSRLSTRPPSP